MAKIQKLLVGEGIDEEEDTTNKLPNYLIHHILSFLAIKFAARTSILSKRWRYIWNSIPNLNFQTWRSSTIKDIHLETKLFMNFMDRMLLSRGEFNIRGFTLECDELCDASRINAWISTVIKYKVEELALSIKVNEPFYVPLSLFTCESLVDLRLTTNSPLCLPQLISFTRLENLVLTGLRFTSPYLTKQLFSNCPVLKRLTLNSCSWMDMNLCIRAHALEKLSINEPNVVNINGLQNCEVHLDAPNLVSLIYQGNIAKGYFLSTFTSLVTAEVDFLNTPAIGSQGEMHAGTNANELVGSLSHVKHLTISGSGGTLKALSLPTRHDKLSTFHSLVHLNVTTAIDHWADKALFAILKKAPYLQSLVFDQGFCVYRHLYVPSGVWLDLNNKFLFVNLKSVELKEFTGACREMKLVTLILKNSKVLQKIIISPSSSLSEKLKTKLKVMEELLRLPRASNCVIEFSRS